MNTTQTPEPMQRPKEDKVPTPVIEFNKVRHLFGDFVAVKGLDLVVNRGERLAILGRTGAGKSTLLNLLIGNMTPTSGTVRIEGRDPYAEHRKLQGRIGMAFQTPRLMPWRTAIKNVATGQEILGVSKAERLANAKRWLDKMHLSDSYHKFPSQLSGGMRQRVSLARAFAVRPAFVLLDESFSALDEVTANTLRQDFVELAEEEDITSLIVTHNIEEAFEMAHRVILLGRPAKILREYDVSKTPKAGTAEFAVIRQEIRDIMLSPEGGISAVGA